MSVSFSDDSMTKMPSYRDDSYSAFRGMVVGFALCSPVWIALAVLIHSI